MPVLMTRPRLIAALCGSLLAACGARSSERGPADWPAESEQDAINLSELCDGFRKDLSGAVWNPYSRTLWVCRNGPGAESKLWVLEEGGDGALQLASQGEVLGEWTGLGDSEGLTFANFEEPVVYVIAEGEEQIHELDVSVYGELVVNRVYDTSPFLPLEGRNGAEGITFIPDEFLTRSGFVDASGVARVSRNGMGGLMFVGHQNGGGIHAFDLDRETGAVDHIGEYRVTAGMGPGATSKVVALEFDRSTNRLLAWHDVRDGSLLSITELASREADGANIRDFHIGQSYRGPGDRNYEGLAVTPGAEAGCTLFLTVDDSKKHALLRFDRFAPQRPR
ncbi:MAG: hypothetical protein ACI8QZ_003078 [Chlamydiales bacterium]|jgi:hypothetical protein